MTAADGVVAVTGASGFTGGHMVRELVHHGYKVRACLRDSASWRGQDAVRYLSRLPGVEIVSGCDLFVPGSFDAAFQGCVGVFHVAAVLGNSAKPGSQPNASGDTGQDTYDGGLVGTQNVLGAINKSGTVQRLIYTSSTSAVTHGFSADGHEWTETDWASDGADPKSWRTAWYARSKVDTEHLVNEAAAASAGAWDAVTMNPAMIVGPLLFAAQNGQWIQSVGELASGTFEGDDRWWNMIDVRDLVSGHRLALESAVDHVNSRGGSRYIMHGTGGRSEMRFGTEVAAVISQRFPSFSIGSPKDAGGQQQQRRPKTKNDSKKAVAMLGVRVRPVEETIVECVESAIELGLIQPRQKGRL